MEIDQHIAALEAEGGTLSHAARCAGLDATVPGCPGWRVADLIRHTGYVHRWATRNILEHPDEVIDEDTEEQILGVQDPSEAELLTWFSHGHRGLIETLKNADPDGQYPVFLHGSPSSLAFWARRQAHETAIHSADAQLAAGQRPRFGADFASDGIDELIMGFAARGRRWARAAAGRSMQVEATDTGAAWRLTTPGEEGARAICERVEPGSGATDCQLAGPAGGMYLLLWNRTDVSSAQVAVTGDTDLALVWRERFHVRW
jgi:uncharacterized protein (TIGR03083 family)